MTDLTDFLLARLRKREQYLAPYIRDQVLRETDAVRRIAALHLDGNAEHHWDGNPDPLPARCTVCHDYGEHEAAPWPCTTLRLLALPYRDHADYDGSWAI